MYQHIIAVTPRSYVPGYSDRGSYAYARTGGLRRRWMTVKRVQAAARLTMVRGKLLSEVELYAPQPDHLDIDH